MATSHRYKYRYRQWLQAAIASGLAVASVSYAAVETNRPLGLPYNDALGLGQSNISTPYDPFQTNISYLSGVVRLLRNGQMTNAIEGQPILRGDVYITAPGARMHVIMGQDTVLEMGGEAELAIPQFQSKTEAEGGLKGWFKLKQGALRIYTLPVTVVRERKFQINLAEDIPQIYAQFGRQNIDITAQVQAEGEQRFLGHSVCTHSGNNIIYEREDNTDRLLETLREANRCYRTDTPDGISPTYALLPQDITARYAASAPQAVTTLTAEQQQVLQTRESAMRQRLIEAQAALAAEAPPERLDGNIMGTAFKLPSGTREEPSNVGPTRSASSLGAPVPATAMQDASITKVPEASARLIVPQQPNAQSIAENVVNVPANAASVRSSQSQPIGDMLRKVARQAPEPAAQTASDIEMMLAGLTTVPDHAASFPTGQRVPVGTTAMAVKQPAIRYKTVVPEPRYTGKGEWRLYLMSIRDLRKATQIAAQLRRAGYDADIEAYIQPSSKQRFARIFIRNLPSETVAKATGNDFLGVFGIRDYFVKKSDNG